MKICILPAPTYPVPAIKGGAVEELIEYLIDQNELHGKLDITVLSSFDEQAYKKASRYKKAHIKFVKYGNLIDKFQEKKLFIYINRIAMKIYGKPILARNYVKRAFRDLDIDSYDAVIVEGGGDIYNYKYLVNHVDKEKLWVHMHADLPGDLAFREMFSNFICVSNYVARTLTMNGIINKKNVYVLPNCVNIQLFGQEDRLYAEQYRIKNNIRQTDFVFIYWGRLMPEKGVLELVRAFKNFKKRHNNSKLLVVGNPKFGYQIETDYTKDLKNEITDSEFQDAIIFTGFIPHDDLWKVIKSADVAIVPSVWNDCAPLVVFEAFASSMPTITTRVGGVGEVANSNNSILIDWGINFEEQLLEAMECLYNDRTLCDRLKENALCDVKQYSIENYYNNFVDIIKLIKEAEK